MAQQWADVLLPSMGGTVREQRDRREASTPFCAVAEILMPPVPGGTPGETPGGTAGVRGRLINYAAAQPYLVLLGRNVRIPENSLFSLGGVCTGPWVSTLYCCIVNHSEQCL